ncbi:hypothetical protein BDY24DRAFT_390846 [Mrakia frigida]|uniref:Mss1p n=1 Tax=Mrakia frigida TaxID=29902 RepID=UPI003FCBF2E7
MKISLTRCSQLLRTSTTRSLSLSSSSSSSPSLRRFTSSTSTPPPYQPPTIYALGTPPGKAGVAVLRISGPAVPEVYKQMIFRRAQQKSARGIEGVLPSPRKMVLREIRVPETAKEDAGEVIDEGLVVYFPAPNSFTTLPLLELHTHSSLSVLTKVLSALSLIPNCRPAERGEFTRQAFLAGRMDLTEVEGLRDLIDAETEGQRRLARGMVGGHLRARYETLREEIIHAMAISEALIDFGEDDNIGEEVLDDARAEVVKLINKIEGHLNDNRRGEIMRSGVKVSIFGPPNAGKSSLLNHLSQRDAAIVSPVPGTTRDIVTVSLDIAGVKVVLSDTAGLRETEDEVEKIGVERAGQEIASSNLRLLILPLPSLLYPWSTLSSVLPPLILPHITPDTLILLNQSDLIPPTLSRAELEELVSEKMLASGGEVRLPEGVRWWIGSLQTGEGMEDFLEEGVGRFVKERFSSGTSLESPLITNERHRHHLTQALVHLKFFLDQPPSEIIFAAESLRDAANEIGKVSGMSVKVDDVLDRLFGEFCIGK